MFLCWSRFISPLTSLRLFNGSPLATFQIDSSDRALTKQQCAPYATEPFLEMIGTLVAPAPGDIQRAAQLPRAG